MRLRHLALSSFFFGIAIVLVITWHVGIGEITDTIVHASVLLLALFLGASLIIALGHTAKWQIALHSQGYHVPFHRLFAYRLVGYSVNYLTPTMHAGSEPIRALLLKREGVPTNEAFSNVIIDKSVELLCNVGFFAFAALLIVNSVAVTRTMKLVVLCISLLLALLMGLFIAGILNEKSMFVAIFRFLRLHKVKRLVAIEENLAEIEKQIEIFYRKKKGHFLAIIAIMTGLWMLMYVEYRTALLIVGHDASIAQVFLILTGVGLAYAVPVPAAMGVLELGQLSAAKVLALSSAMGIALAFLIRARDLLWTIIGLTFLGIYQFNFTKLARTTHDIDKRFEKGRLYEAK